MLSRIPFYVPDFERVTAEPRSAGKMPGQMKERTRCLPITILMVDMTA
jgi:hypothetical protein